MLWIIYLMQRKHIKLIGNHIYYVIDAAEASGIKKVIKNHVDYV